MDEAHLEDYLFLWRIILSIMVCLALPWVINISKNVAILVAEVHALRQAISAAKVYTTKKFDDHGRRIRSVELDVNELKTRRK